MPFEPSTLAGFRIATVRVVGKLGYLVTPQLTVVTITIARLSVALPLKVGCCSLRALDYPEIFRPLAEKCSSKPFIVQKIMVSLDLYAKRATKFYTTFIYRKT